MQARFDNEIRCLRRRSSGECIADLDFLGPLNSATRTNEEQFKKSRFLKWHSLGIVPRPRLRSVPISIIGGVELREIPGKTRCLATRA